MAKTTTIPGVRSPRASASVNVGTHRPRVYGKYQLLERLARGGMAEVFKAKSHGVEGFEKILVIKRILDELGENPRFVDMFINEAKIAVTLSHANIVQVFDLGRANGSFFIAMEYVAGFDLATILKTVRDTDATLPPELAVFIVSEVAKGLDYAHRRRDASSKPLHIVHRDVSPQNVLLSFEGEVKLTDFGIAKARTTVDERTEAGILKGKHAYMAPEQANGDEVDARTDLFSLGTVLYEALSGRNPFLERSVYDTLSRVREVDIVPLRELASHVPEELCNIVTTAMSRDPGERHPDAGRLYEALIQFLYSSGRRVGARDLADYLEGLKESIESQPPADDATDLRAAFDLDPRSYDSPAPTPVARIRRERTAVVSPDDATPRSQRERVVTNVARPQAEQRDVATLAIHLDARSPFPQTKLEAHLQRAGALITEYSSEPEGRHWTAVFGVLDPDGRETESAVRCALALARASRLRAEQSGFNTLQIAVHSGRLLVDISGELLRDDRYRQLTQDTHAVATTAPYGKPLATPVVEATVRSIFELAPEGEEHQVTAGRFRIVAERNLTEHQGKFIGRRDELRRIGESLAQANQGHRRIVGIVGDAGAGKTRLLLETTRRLRLGGHDVGMYVARISKRSRNVPLAACQEMLRVVLGIDEFEAEADVREKIGRLRELGLPGVEIQAVRVTLGVAQDRLPETTVAQPLLSALARIASKLAEDRLTVFALDGVESIDDESLALLYSLLRDDRSARVVLMLSFRPGMVHAWSNLPDYHEIRLQPLSEDEITFLISARLRANEVPADLLREVSVKSGGNPLYVEEYLKALRDAEAVVVESDRRLIFKPEVAVEVPKTLRGIVAARLARIGPTERHLLQIAAITSARFPTNLLAAVAAEPVETVEQSLTVLEQRGIVVRAGHEEYAFSHELIGDVLREGLTIDAQRELHGAVAGALEQLYPEHVHEMAERLVDHHRRAGNRSKAIDYLIRSADRLESEYALTSAAASLGEAIDMLGQTPNPDHDRILSLYRRLGDLSFRSGAPKKGIERMEAGLALAESLGREDCVSRFSMLRGRLLYHSNRFAEEARQWFDRARDIARKLGDPQLLLDVTVATADASTRNGHYSHAIGLLQEALNIAKEASDRLAQVRCLIPLSLAYAGTGDREGAIQAIADARQLSTDDRYTECELLKAESLVNAYVGDQQRAIETAGRAMEFAKEYGFPFEAAVNAHNMGECYLRSSDYKRAFALSRYSYEIARDQGLVRLQYTNMRVLGFIDAIKFGSSEGRDRMLEALEYATEHGYLWDVIQCKYMLAVADHRTGNTDSGEDLLREVLRLATEYGHRYYEQAAEEALAAVAAGKPVPLPH